MRANGRRVCRCCVSVDVEDAHLKIQSAVKPAHSKLKGAFDISEFASFPLLTHIYVPVISPEVCEFLGRAALEVAIGDAVAFHAVGREWPGEHKRINGVDDLLGDRARLERPGHGRLRHDDAVLVIDKMLFASLLNPADEPPGTGRQVGARAGDRREESGAVHVGREVECRTGPADGILQRPAVDGQEVVEGARPLDGFAGDEGARFGFWSIEAHQNYDTTGSATTVIEIAPVPVPVAAVAVTRSALP